MRARVSASWPRTINVNEDSKQTMSNTLQLAQDDTALLADVIRSYLNGLHDEAAHTDNYELREALHEKQRRLNALLEQLGGS